MVLVIIIGGLGFIKLLTNLFQEGAALAFNGVSKADAYVLPADYYKYTTPFESEMQKDSMKNNRERICLLFASMYFNSLNCCY